MKIKYKACDNGVYKELEGELIDSYRCNVTNRKLYRVRCKDGTILTTLNVYPVYNPYYSKYKR